MPSPGDHRDRGFWGAPRGQHLKSSLWGEDSPCLQVPTDAGGEEATHSRAGMAVPGCTGVHGGGWGCTGWMDGGAQGAQGVKTGREAGSGSRLRFTFSEARRVPETRDLPRHTAGMGARRPESGAAQTAPGSSLRPRVHVSRASTLPPPASVSPSALRGSEPDRD